MAEGSPEILTSDAVRRQVLLEGVKEQEWKDFSKYLKDIERQVRARLLEEGDTIRTRARLEALIREVTAIQQEIYLSYTDSLVDSLDEVALVQADLEADTLNRVVIDFETVVPAPEQIITAYQRNLLSIDGQSFDLKPFLKEFTQSQIQVINSSINQGFIEGQTISQIVRNIRGTRAANFNDGDIGKINRSDRAMVRTAVQNASTQAKERIWKANKNLVIGVEMVATLDSRTSDICRSLDGRIFPVDEGPRPPFHYACRTTTAPVLSEEFDYLSKNAKRPAKGAKGATQVGAQSVYYGWLKTQPASFQDAIIGKTRGRLLRNGGLTSKEFAKLQLNRNFKPRTLADMKRIAPEAFAQANL